MANEINVSEDIRKLAKLYESMVTAADMLEEIGKNKQISAECKRDADQARSDLSVVLGQVAVANEDVRKAKAIAKDIEADAKSKAMTIEIGAKAEADNIIKQAKEREAQMLTDADAKVQAALGLEFVKANALKAEKAELEGAVTGLKTLISELTDKAADSEARLAKAQAAIAKLINA
jgi:hypothetical protein